MVQYRTEICHNFSDVRKYVQQKCSFFVNFQGNMTKMIVPTSAQHCWTQKINLKILKMLVKSCCGDGGTHNLKAKIFFITPKPQNFSIDIQHKIIVSQFYHSYSNSFYRMDIAYLKLITYWPFCQNCQENASVWQNNWVSTI